MKTTVTFRRDKRTGELYAYENGKRKGKISTSGGGGKRAARKRK